MELGESVHEGRVPFGIEWQAYLIGDFYQLLCALLLFEIDNAKECAHHQYDKYDHEERHHVVHDSSVSFHRSGTI